MLILKIIALLQSVFSNCIMIIDFAIKNFLSFKDEVVFSMLAAKSVKENETDDNSNIFVSNETNQRFVKVAALYGANGSGKSNLVSALSFFRNMLINSYGNNNILREFRQKQFLFNKSNQDSTGFEINMNLNGVRYRYGFEILDEKIEDEWLFMQPFGNPKESYCFKRFGGQIKTNSKVFKAPKQIIDFTRDNTLFLTTAALSKMSIAEEIQNWFENDFNIISGIDDRTINYTAERYLNDEEMRKRIIEFIRIADFGIQDINVEETLIEKVSDIKDPILRKILGDTDYENTPFEEKIKALNIQSYHNQYDNGVIIEKMPIPFGRESIGTIKIFAIIGPWLDTLMNGKTLIVDEFGASIHTKLSIELIRLFQSKLNNGAQLIVTTHDTNLLRKDLLRRDQIWFVEKDKQGVSDLYSLAEYKINQATSVRNDASFSKDYLLGKYGAIPHFGDIQKFIEEYGKE